MVDRDAHLGDKTINKHKENIININKWGHFWWEEGSWGQAGTLGQASLEESKVLLSGYLYLYFILQ